jgi:predicted AAA+ superfamily ATPase
MALIAPFLDDIFKTLDTDTALREIEALSGIPVTTPGAILFLDEIQSTPHALQLLRYLYEEKKGLPVIAAGSLLEFTLSDHSFSMPVGRIEYMHLGPMTFTEFLLAAEPALTRYVEKFSMTSPFPAAAHEKLKKAQRKYVFTGGMPEAVQAWCKSGSLKDVGDVHRSISETYEVEVKSGKSGSLKSLQQFVTKKNISLAVRFDLNPPGLQKTAHRINTGTGIETAGFSLLSLPLYLVEALPKVLNEIREQTPYTAQ